MANFAPTEIPQVADFTPRSGDALLNIMSRESNPYNNIMDLVDRTVGAYTKAQESERMADAITKVRLALENGKTVPEAYEGIDSRLLGTKALQDRTDAIRDSLLNADKNKLAWKREEREAAAQAITNRLANLQIQEAMDKRNADSLIASLMEHRNKFSSAGDSLWYNDHLKQIKSSPTVYKQIMSEMANAGSSVLPSAPIDSTNFTPYTVQQFDNDRRKFQQFKNKLNQTGLSDEWIKLADKIKTPEDYIKMRNEVMKYEDGDLRDYSNNTNKAFNIAQSYAKSKGYPTEVIPYAIKLAESGSWWGANDYNFNTIKSTLDSLAPVFTLNMGNYKYLENAINLFNNPESQKTLENENTNLHILIDRIDRLEKTGALSSDRANALKSSIYNKYNTITAQYTLGAQKAKAVQ